MRKNPLSRASVSTEEVPVPRCGRGQILLANRFSLISAGTETASIKRNVKDMVVKGLSDPQLRDSVKEMLLKDGITRTADRVLFETSKWTPMGYSGAGVALEVGQDVDGIREGDLVAYGGEGHAEYIRSNKNLSVGVPEGVSARDAAFVALGSIAMQGVRRAEIQVGDVVVVLGLGLVGQLVSQLVTAAGGRVIGIDVLESRCELARTLGAEHVLKAGTNVPDDVLRYTGGVGADRVLICAATSSSVVVEQAMTMSRDRGRVVVVGLVGMDIPHAPFFKKELDFVISRSYGPGRYDAQYEQHGIDYPIGYVRWTERRNMQEFLRLVQAGRAQVSPLVTHEFALPQAAEAYDLLTERPGECLGIVLRYDDVPSVQTRLVPTSRPPAVSAAAGPVNVAVIGCGAFARQFHLPNIKSSPDLRLRTLVASSGQSAKEMGERYGASFSTTDIEQAIADPEVGAVMIFTRDTGHAKATVAALKAGKHVFCEKPLATSYAECAAIARQAEQAGRLCFTGFNRRFAPLVRRTKQLLSGRTGPAMLTYRVSAGALPPDSWTYDPTQSAGRIVGEACHFVDLLYWLVGAEIVSVHAHAVGPMTSLVRLEDVAATLTFADGSVGSLIYTARGNTRLGKERLEVFWDGNALAMDDFRQLSVQGRQSLKERDSTGDKGHGAELAHFAQAVRGKVESEITYLDGIRGTVGALRIYDSAVGGVTMPVSLAPEDYPD